MKFRIVAYKIGSQSARLLAEAISRLVGYRVYRGTEPKANRRNINWGVGNRIGGDKLATFRAFSQHNVSCPEYTTDAAVARGWLARSAVVARRLLRSFGGRGITYIERGGNLVPAPLYVKYVPKKKEFRVHVYNNQVILIQEKRRRRGTRPDAKIRSQGS